MSPRHFNISRRQFRLAISRRTDDKSDEFYGDDADGHVIANARNTWTAFIKFDFENVYHRMFASPGTSRPSPLPFAVSLYRVIVSATPCWPLQNAQPAECAHDARWLSRTTTPILSLCRLAHFHTPRRAQTSPVISVMLAWRPRQCLRV